MSFLSRLTGSSTPDESSFEASQPIEASLMHWRADTALPLPDWNAMQAPVDAFGGALHIFWSGAARAWLEELGATLGKHYAITESKNFMWLAALRTREQQIALNYAEQTRRRILQFLTGIARDDGYGKTVILVFDSMERYYDYIAHYYPDSPEHGEFAFSGGMFIDDGYGHFVFVADDLQRLEPVIAHELTHCLVRHLPLPAWVNEGIAVNTEQRLCPPQGSMFTLDELREKHLLFWNDETIQEFWSGKSWLRPDDGNLLSYDLAKTFITLAARDWNAFVPFINAADSADAAEAAARQYLGYSVAHLAEAVLGVDRWVPDPARWSEGVERGQFAER